VTKHLAQVSAEALELHFEGSTAAPIFSLFSVTTSGWHECWLLTQVDGAYANNSKCLVKSEKISWSRRREIMRWFYYDPANLLPLNSASHDDAVRVTNHMEHLLSGLDEEEDTCPVRRIDQPEYGTGWVINEKVIELHEKGT
jgi:hypothetical protein